MAMQARPTALTLLPAPPTAQLAARVAMLQVVLVPPLVLLRVAAVVLEAVQGQQRKAGRRK